jgi:hypothetical protein
MQPKLETIFNTDCVLQGKARRTPELYRGVAAMAQAPLLQLLQPLQGAGTAIADGGVLLQYEHG